MVDEPEDDESETAETAEAAGEERFKGDGGLLGSGSGRGCGYGFAVCVRRGAGFCLVVFG